jgi:hypothetical protein
VGDSLVSHREGVRCKTVICQKAFLVSFRIPDNTGAIAKVADFCLPISDNVTLRVMTECDRNRSSAHFYSPFQQSAEDRFCVVESFRLPISPGHFRTSVTTANKPIPTRTCCKVGGKGLDSGPKIGSVRMERQCFGVLLYKPKFRTPGTQN